MGLRHDTDQWKLPYFVNEGEITHLEDFSGKPPYDKSDYHPWDIGLKVVVTFKKKNGGTYDGEFWLGGDIAKNEKGEWIGWANAWRLNKFLCEFGIRVGEDGIPEIDQPGIPTEIISELQGKHVMLLRYVKKENPERKGHYWYGKFNVLRYLSSPDDSSAYADVREELIGHFLKSVERGYPSDYSPEILKSKPPVQKKKLSVPVDDENIRPEVLYSSTEDAEHPPDFDAPPARGIIGVLQALSEQANVEQKVSPASNSKNEFDNGSQEKPKKKQ